MIPITAENNFCPWGIQYEQGKAIEKVVFHALRFSPGFVLAFLHRTIYCLGVVFRFNPGPIEGIAELAHVDCFVPWGEAIREAATPKRGLGR